MNSRILSAFLGGALLASTTVYLLVRPRGGNEEAVQAAPAAAAKAQQAVQQAAPPPIEAVPADDVKPSPAPQPAHAIRERPAKSEATAPRMKRYAAPPDPPEPVAQATLAPPPPLSAEEESAPAEPVAINATPPAPAPKPVAVTIRPGTLIQARLGETLSTRMSRAGDTFRAALAAPLVVDGWVIAERGARAYGKVVESDKAGRVTGVARLNVQLTRIVTSDGQNIPLDTLAFSEKGRTSRREDGVKVGALAGLGAAIGAIAGGGAGAGIGALAGGAAGAGDVMATRGKDAVLPVETRISFRVQQPVTITERTN